MGLGRLDVDVDADASLSGPLPGPPGAPSLSSAIERFGRLEATDVRFRDREHLMRVIERIAARVGRRIDAASPMADLRL